MARDWTEATRRYYLSSLRAAKGDRRVASIRTRNWLGRIRTTSRLLAHELASLLSMNWTVWAEEDERESSTRQHPHGLDVGRSGDA